MILREARVEDLPRLIELSRDVAERSLYAHAPLDEGAIRHMMLFCISSKSQFFWVAEFDGQIEAMLAGGVEKIWYSTKKAASEIFYHATEKGASAAGLLARRFVRWARKRPGVVSVSLSIPQQDPRAKRSGKMLQKLGLTHTVSVYEEIRDVQEAHQGRQEAHQGRRPGDQEGR
jgi:hypothetical protein